MLDFIYISIALIYVVLTIFVFKRDLKSPINRYYLIFLIGLLFWHVTLYLYLFVNLGDYLLFIGRLNYATGPIFSMGLLGFFYYFPVTSFKIPRWVIYLFWIVTLVLVGITQFTPLIDKMETMTDLGPVPTLGDGYYYYLAHVFLLPVATLILGAVKNFRLKGLNRLRFEYSFWVFVPTMIAFLISNLILPIFGIIDQFAYSPLFLTPIAVSSFYAIAKFRFLDMRLVLARAAAYLFFIAICCGVYALVVFGILARFFGVNIDPTNAWSALGIAVFAALSFQPLLRILRRVTNKLFYKNYTDTEKLLGESTHTMAQTIELSSLSMAMLNLLMKKLSISKGALMIFDKDKVIETFTSGYDKSVVTTPDFEKSIAKYVKSHSIIIYEEIPENNVKKFFRDSDISIAIPMKVKNSVVAILLLGSKLTGEVYGSQDIDFLAIFAPEAGIAVQNAKSYEQIRQFNISLEKKVEERTHQLKSSQMRELAKARDLAKLKDEFVFIASHELRTPVTAIRGFLQMVKADTKTLPASVKENLGYMSQASDHLGQLINDLLEISRADAGRMQVETKPMDIVPITKEIIQEALPQAKNSDISITFDVDKKTGPAMIDDKKFKEVVMNLLSNAIKYNRKGGKVKVGIKPLHGKMIVEVTDNGYGISKDQQKRIFEKFFRAQNHNTGDVLGTGLGLFLTKMIVEKMGGKISFTSQEGKGTTFTVSLIPGKKTATAR